MTDIKTSKFLSRVLRHEPQAIGIALDPAGWVGIDTLLAAMAQHNHPIPRTTLDRIVAENPKQRFVISPDGSRIRAAQGHSVPVALGLPPSPPPEVLYHGTAVKHLPAIRAQGLMPQGRQQVHLSADPDTARTVGARHGTPRVLHVRAAAMAAAGHLFVRAENGVWLTDHVPTAFLSHFEVRP